MKSLSCAAALALCCIGQASAQQAPPPPAAYDTAQAAQAQRALSECLVRSTSERDKRDLVKWIFIVMSRHPDVRPMVSVSAKEDEAIGRAASAVFESLIAEKCTDDIRTAMRRSGTDAIKQSFEYLGKTAMDSLLEQPEVEAAAGSLLKYADPARIQRAIGEK